MTTFADHFWGPKNNGYFALYHNMKHGQTSTKELIDFLRESCTVEENYSKLLSKLAKLAANTPPVGTFGPFWNILKSLIEKLSTVQMQLVHTWSDLIKDMIRYSEEQHKRHKTIKENEQATLDSVQTIQQTTTALHKAREIYHTRCLEMERLKRDNASQRDIEKAEVKYKKAMEEYKSYIEKYKEVRNVFEEKMVGSCHHYQELEEEHICQMKDFIDTFAKSWENEHAVLGQVHKEFKQNCDEMTVQKLISTFVEKKGTGNEKPGPMEFVEPDLSSLLVNRPMSPELNGDKRDSVVEKQKQEASGTPSPVLSDQPGPLSRSVKLRVSRTWFLKNKTKRKEKKKKNSKKDKDEKDGESIEADNQDPNIEVDEEGYRIRPEHPMDNNGDKNSWYSSDSDSDSEEESRRKIKVEIRPLSPTSGPSSTVEDIRASVEGLRLSPSAMRKRSQTPIDKKMKRSQSESDTLDKPGNQDLLNLDFFGSNSAASTPTGVNYNVTLPSPLSPQTEINWNSTNSSAATTPSARLNALLCKRVEKNFADFANQNNGKQPTSTILSPTSPLSGLPPPVARPPSRTRGLISQPKLNGPLPMSRSDSNGSMTFNTTSMPIGSSRGPSPLTIGMSDSVPLAVAFTETVNAYFKGHDAKKCVVRTMGNVMMSFPAGVVKVFTENPSPALLSFRIKNADKWEQVITNSSILSKDEAQSTPDVHTYEFSMSNLIDHLRQQGEQNKSASYFNIDILKYQVKALPGVESTPLPLVVYWKCEESATEFRLDYRYNPSAMSSAVTLKNVNVAVPVDGDVLKMHSIPNGTWDAVAKRASWKLNDISEVSEQESQGSIRAKFELGKGPTKPVTTAMQFAAEGATLSGSEFELAGPGYRISLMKKRFATGKYYVDPEPTVSYV
ncbi:F-BAR domain only protein 2-like isoform X2 [Physella acuta]|uniref:F-BAR domain only protein 2-like isoform X2 n=1 Tax=Physella acuta TaxID=109671 RepID=UPI0027DDBBD4|nr:F-BAR domain only protein 2-like isoform X2 [Physella acuta]